MTNFPVPRPGADSTLAENVIGRLQSPTCLPARESEIASQPPDEALDQIDAKTPIEIDPKALICDFFNSWPIDERASYTNLMLEQYKLYASHMEKEVDREISRNSIFLSTNAALVAVAGIAIANLSIAEQLLPLFTIFTLAAVINTSWAALISQSRRASRMRKTTLTLYETCLPTRPFWFDLQVAHSTRFDRIFGYAQFPIIYIATICTAVAWAIFGAQLITVTLHSLLLPVLWWSEDAKLIYPLDHEATTTFLCIILIGLCVVLIKLNRFCKFAWDLSWSTIHEVRRDMLS